MITRADKAETISEITDRFSKAKAAFLVDFKGMSVEQVTDLRKKLFHAKSEMKVVRNTLARRALAGFPKMEAAFKEDLVGTNAVVFAYDDISQSAKTISEYAKAVEIFQVKMGVLDGSRLDAEGIKALASLPSKDVLRAMLLGTMAAPMSKFVRTLAAVPSGFVRVLAAKNEKA